MCCMKGEKVSTPLDKDGRGPSGLYNTHTVKALPPTSWHLTMFFRGSPPCQTKSFCPFLNAAIFLRPAPPAPNSSTTQSAAESTREMLAGGTQRLLCSHKAQPRPALRELHQMGGNEPLHEVTLRKVIASVPRWVQVGEVCAVIFSYYQAGA